MNNWDLYRYAHRGGGTTDTRFKSLVERTITDVSDDSITTVGDYAFYNCKTILTVNFSNAITVGYKAFAECTGISTVYLPNVTTITAAAFHLCSNMTSVYCPNATYINSDTFKMCAKLTTVNLPNVTGFGSNVFSSCTNLTAVVIRTATVATLTNANTFNNTPIANGTGYIYVPDELVDNYKTATNWVIYADQIKPLSEYGGD